jgi:tRNA U38,U39,U40 pseudouridine synthase TruA
MIRVGVLQYHCFKCGKHQVLELRPIMSDSTSKLFADMFDVKLCGECFIDNKIPELVGCLLH